MPTVPRLQSRVDQAPIPGVRVSTGAPAEAFGVAAPIDLSGPTRLAAAIDASNRQKADQVAVLDADNQLSTFKSELEREALKVKGKDALGASDIAAAAWKEKAGDIERGLQGDAQKLAFRQRAQLHWSSLDGTVARHADAEFAAYDTDETLKGLSNRLNDAVANVNDPAKVATAIAQQQAIVKDFARRQGMGPEATKARLESVTSQSHLAVLSALTAQGNDLTATSYFTAHKDELKGDDLIRATSAVEEGSSRGESQRQAAQIVAAGGTLTEQLAKARQIADPRVQDLTVTRIRQNDTETKAAAREQAESNMVSAGNIIDQTGSWTRIPPAMWTLFSPAQKASLKSYAEQRVAGGTVKTDLATYYGLKLAAANEPDKFATKNLLEYRDRLSPADFEEMVNAQVKVRKGEESPLKGYLTQHDMISSAIAGLGWKRTPQRAAIEQAVDDEIKNIKRTTKREVLPDTEVQDIVDRLVLKTVYVKKPWWQWDDERVAGSLSVTERGDAYVPYKEIAEPDRKRIERDLRTYGKPIVERTIERAAAAARLGDRATYDAIVGARARGSVSF